MLIDFFMKVEQVLLNTKTGWNIPDIDDDIKNNAQLILVFASPSVVQNQELFQNLADNFSVADIVFCSTSGEIYSQGLYDDSACINILYFEKTKIQVISQDIEAGEESYTVGKRGVELLPQEDLRHILVLSDGNIVNGDQLVQGCKSGINSEVSISGGLAGGGVDFGRSFIGHNMLPSSSRKIVFIGLYGDNINIQAGSGGGWNVFGPKRSITKSKDNIVYEFDGEAALELYERYLGEYADDLPKSGITFPMSISKNTNDKAVVRTLLEINKDDKSVRFAGDMPEGYYAQMMKANFDLLIDGAHNAGQKVQAKAKKADIAILISCIGRRLALKHRIEDEIEAVAEALGDDTPLAGFYSYGEIAPSGDDILSCELHNQTMTITLLSET